MTKTHLIKLTVGCSSVHDLHRWQNRVQFWHNGQPAGVVNTRYMPKRAEEILQSGGSIYRVINNCILCRQPIIDFTLYDSGEAGTKCQIIVSPEIIITQPMPKKAFQGWRYLKPEDAPPDVGLYEEGTKLPPAQMQQELQALGLL
jgi:hypothetical protein